MSTTPSASSQRSAVAAQPDATPWWRLPIVWMVIGGPAVVVVASFVTLTLAILNPDPVLEPAKTQASRELPAMQARNHAATTRP